MPPHKTKDWAIFQRKLFRMIELNAGNQMAYSLPEVIMDLLDLKKTATYQKINAKTPLKMQELLVLVQTFNINLFELIGNGHENRVMLKLHAKNEEDDLFYRLMHMNQCLEMINESHQANILCSSSGIPFFFLLPFPRLFMFQFYTGQYLNAPSPNIQNFDKLMLMPDKKSMSALSRISQNLTTLDQSYIIHHNAFGRITTWIHYLEELGLFRDADIGKLIHQELLRLIRQLENQCSPGSGGKSALSEKKFNLFITDKHQLESIILMDNNEFFNVSGEVFQPGEWHSGSVPLFRNYARRFNHIKDHSVNIAGQNRISRTAFFRSISDNLNGIKMD